MPVIYQGQCQNCQHKSPHTSGGYAAVVLDEPAEHTTSHPDDHRIVVLAHPLEPSILKSLGYTFTSATLAGRFLVIHECFCNSCGNLYEVRKLGTSAAVGCLPSLIVGILFGTTIGMLRHNAFLGLLAGFLTTTLLVPLIEQLIAVFVSWRYTKRAREFGTPKRCPKCGDKKGIRPGWRRAMLRCPACGQITMQIKTVGIS